MIIHAAGPQHKYSCVRHASKLAHIWHFSAVEDTAEVCLQDPKILVKADDTSEPPTERCEVIIGGCKLISLVHFVDDAHLQVEAGTWEWDLDIGLLDLGSLQSMDWKAHLHCVNGKNLLDTLTRSGS